MAQDLKNLKSSKSPLVSVVMSAYNAEKYIKEAIDSILGQTFTDFEFIIINDGSTDDTLKIIKSYKDPRIVLISRENKGLVASLNEGIERARGKYIARMDADDISMPERFAKQVEHMESHPEVGLVGSQFAVIDGNGEIQKKLISRPVDDYDIRLLLGYGTIFAHSSVLFKKDLFMEVGGYNEKYYLAEDHDLWCRMAEITTIHNLLEVLLWYRISQFGISLDNESRQIKVMRQISKRWRSQHSESLDAIIPTRLIAVIKRYKKLGRVQEGYSLKIYLQDLVNLFAGDINRSDIHPLFKIFKKINIKISGIILRNYG